VEYHVLASEDIWYLDCFFLYGLYVCIVYGLSASVKLTVAEERRRNKRKQPPGTGQFGKSRVAILH